MERAPDFSEQIAFRAASTRVTAQPPTGANYPSQLRQLTRFWAFENRLITPGLMSLPSIIRLPKRWWWRERTVRVGPSSGRVIVRLSVKLTLLLKISFSP
jgi:hypothetical protein